MAIEPESFLLNCRGLSGELKIMRLDGTIDSPCSIAYATRRFTKTSIHAVTSGWDSFSRDIQGAHPSAAFDTCGTGFRDALLLLLLPSARLRSEGEEPGDGPGDAAIEATPAEI